MLAYGWSTLHMQKLSRKVFCDYKPKVQWRVTLYTHGINKIYCCKSQLKNFQNVPIYCAVDFLSAGQAAHFYTAVQRLCYAVMSTESKTRGFVQAGNATPR